jgi:molybdate transport system ATP-binding protein
VDDRAAPAEAIVIALDVEVTAGEFSLVVHEKVDARVLAVLGPSGAGKSTLLEALAGLRGQPAERRVGWVPQDVLLFPHLDVARNIVFGARKAIEEALDVLELRPLLQRSPTTLSGGERQRVALARALASDPEMLLLDEPLSAVDVAHRARIVPFLLGLGTPTILVTHDLGEATAMASHALLLRKGRVERVGTIGEAIGAAIAAVPDLDINNLFRQGDATYAIAADEIMIATKRPESISARNILSATIVNIVRVGSDAIVESSVDDQILRARVTSAAVESLGLKRGTQVFLVIKKQALRA